MSNNLKKNLLGQSKKLNFKKLKFNILGILIFSFLVYSCSKSDEEINPSNGIIYGVNKSAMLTLINNYRTSGCTCGTTYMRPVAKLLWNEKLGQSAYKHTLDMANNSFFSHTSKDGRTLTERFFAENYSFSSAGENIANGQISEEAVMEGWINSPGHCRNIMNENYKEVGFARVENYWTQNFGTPRL